MSTRPLETSQRYLWNGITILAVDINHSYKYFRTSQCFQDRPIPPYIVITGAHPPLQLITARFLPSRVVFSPDPSSLGRHQKSPPIQTNQTPSGPFSPPAPSSSENPTARTLNAPDSPGYRDPDFPLFPAFRDADAPHDHHGGVADPGGHGHDADCDADADQLHHRRHHHYYRHYRLERGWAEQWPSGHRRYEKALRRLASEGRMQLQSRHRQGRWRGSVDCVWNVRRDWLVAGDRGAESVQ